MRLINLADGSAFRFKDLEGFRGLRVVSGNDCGVKIAGERYDQNTEKWVPLQNYVISAGTEVEPMRGK